MVVRPSSRGLVAGLALLALGLAALPAMAAPGDEERKVAARALAKKGYELYDAESYEKAIAALKDAEALYHAPTLVFMQAKAHAKLGRLIEARSLFQKVADEKLAPSASSDFRKAQASAKQELASLKGQVPTLHVTVTGAAGRVFTVSLDGKSLPPSDLDRSLEQDPGQHRIAVVPAGGAEILRVLTLKPAERADVVIQIPALARAPEDAASAAASSGRRGSLVPSFVAFGVGAAGLGVGVGLGVVTLGKARAIKANCAPDGLCPASERAPASTANTLAAVSTAGFVVAGVGAALGATFLVLRAPRGPARVGLSIGPLSVSAEGVF